MSAVVVCVEVHADLLDGLLYAWMNDRVRGGCAVVDAVSETAIDVPCL